MTKQYKHGEELRKFWRDNKRRYRANRKIKLAQEEQRKKWEEIKPKTNTKIKKEL